MDVRSYRDFADNDCEYFIKDYESGRVANYMASMAQGICEKYMKHIIDKYDEPTDEISAARKTAVLRTHDLAKIMNYLETAGCHIDPDVRLRIQGANGYYFTARYPGEDSIEVTREDIEICAQAVRTCRDEMLSLEHRILQEQESDA